MQEYAIFTILLKLWAIFGYFRTFWNLQVQNFDKKNLKLFSHSDSKIINGVIWILGYTNLPKMQEYAIFMILC